MTAIEWTHRPGTKGETWNPVTGCTKVSASWHQLVHAAHCLVGDHAWTTEVPISPTGERSTTLRQRCLYCRRTSPGISQPATPGYHYSAGMERPAAALVMHNARLRRCPCVECEERRHARRAVRAKVQPLRRSA